MDFGFHVREVRGALDRYNGRVLSLYKRNPLTLLQEGGSFSLYFPLNTGVKSLQSSTLNARMSLTESLNQGVFFNASIAM